jgi:hypothetical protein
MHLKLCYNEATDLQYEILAKQMPSMNQRIQEAYKNTREFVNLSVLLYQKRKSILYQRYTKCLPHPEPPDEAGVL